MKIAIIGPGAMGCFLAIHFQQAGAEVWLLDHRPDRAAYLQAQGVRLLTLDQQEKHVRIPCTCQAVAIGPCDLSLMMVKAHQTRVAAQSLPPLLAGGGLALTLQNGVGNVEHLAAVVGPEPLLAGVTMHGVTMLGVGQVRHAGAGMTILGIPPGSQVSPVELDRWVAWFQTAGIECTSTRDIVATLWDKLLINVGINPLTALTRLHNGELLTVPAAWEVATAAVQEAQAVAAAAGITLSPEPLSRLRRVCQATARNRSSMLQDVLANRLTEIEALNAQIVSRGQALGVPTPVNATLTRLIRALETSFTSAQQD